MLSQVLSTHVSHRVQRCDLCFPPVETVCVPCADVTALMSPPPQIMLSPSKCIWSNVQVGGTPARPTRSTITAPLGNRARTKLVHVRSCLYCHALSIPHIMPRGRCHQCCLTGVEPSATPKWDVHAHRSCHITVATDAVLQSVEPSATPKQQSHTKQAAFVLRTHQHLHFFWPPHNRQFFSLLCSL